MDQHILRIRVGCGVGQCRVFNQQARFYPITKTIYELFQLLGTGRYLASALGVWAMVFLTVAILGTSLLLGRKMGAIFRV